MGSTRAGRGNFYRRAAPTLVIMKNELVKEIIGFLRQSIADGTVPSDDKESLEVAIDCIGDSFGVETDAQTSDLLALYTKAQGSADKPAAGASAGAAASSTSNATAATTESAQVPSADSISPEQKEKAEKLKLEGNRHMAQKNYPEAIESYSQAIVANPASALYYSNRAAAYTQLGQGQKAVEDARRAVTLDPSYSKAYSRLGLALYSVGDLEGSLKAYERGLEAEGAEPTDGMRRGYETVKKRYDEELALAAAATAGAAADEAAELSSGSRGVDAGAGGADAGAGAGSDPLGGMFGAGGLGGGLGGLANMMKNPEIQKMAQGLMSNPGAMSELMNNPTAKKVRESFQNGQGPNLGELMSDPNLQNLMNSFMGSMGKK